ncbi:MAG: hypothetical protein SFV21_19525 [Rhodospirillaceae bacterium]|nr:hypothetical protein [Rhodospirillaceae bacterium]
MTNRSALAFAAAAALALGVAACAPPPKLIADCVSSGEITVYCGMEKPEDIAAVPGTPWLLVSVLGSSTTSGQIVALNPSDGSMVRLAPTDGGEISGDPYPRCGPMPVFLKPRGFHLHQAGDGRLILFVVNADSGQHIERYEVGANATGLSLVWRGCVDIPKDYIINDVAALSPDSFVATHMYDGPRTWWSTVRFFLGLNSGYAVTWSPDTGWRKVANSDASFPNGIEADPATGMVYVAATYGETLTVVNVAGGAARTVDLPIQPDNITRAADGRLIAVGHTGIKLIGTSGCRSLGGKPCSFDFAVVAVDPNTLQTTTVYDHRQGTIPGASVALIHDGGIFLGTVFGDRISRVAEPPG